jgi:hypothetical protein
MQTVTIAVPDTLAEQLDQMRDRLPELLELSLRQPPIPASVYREILAFLADNPTPEQIAAFGPPPEMQQRLQTLLARERDSNLTEAERDELAEFERIEHLMIMIKAKTVAQLSAMS